MPDLPFATGYYIDESSQMAKVECTNVVPEFVTIGGQQKEKLRAPPGISLFTEAGTKASRGQWTLDEIAYEVAGNTLYRINEDETSTALGTISGTGKVSIASSPTELCIIVPASTGYIYTVAGGLVEITDVDFTVSPSIQVVFNDGRFLHVTEDKFFAANLGNGLLFDALDFAAAEVLPDKITSIFVVGNEPNIGGVETTEPFGNIGGADFPYQRIGGGVVKIGIKAKFSLVEFAKTFAFIGGSKNETPSVYLFAGLERIATDAIDLIIAEQTDDELKDMFCTTYAERGGFFLNVHFKNRTMTYNRANGLWHERTSKDVNGVQTNWRVNGIISAYGKTIVTDNQSGRIGVFDKDVNTEYGDTVKRIFSTIPFINEGNRLMVSEMEVVMENGTGLINNCTGNNIADIAIADCAIAG